MCLAMYVFMCVYTRRLMCMCVCVRASARAFVHTCLCFNCFLSIGYYYVQGSSIPPFFIDQPLLHCIIKDTSWFSLSCCLHSFTDVRCYLISTLLLVNSCQRSQCHSVLRHRRSIIFCFLPASPVSLMCVTIQDRTSCCFYQLQDVLIL